MRLCSRLLAKESHLEEKRLMLLCAQAALNGKYDDRILQYLADAYEGSCSELEVLLQAAKNFEIDIWKINRKLLVQLLFTGQDVSGWIFCGIISVRAAVRSWKRHFCTAAPMQR